MASHGSPRRNPTRQRRAEVRSRIERGDVRGHRLDQLAMPRPTGTAAGACCTPVRAGTALTVVCPAKRRRNGRPKRSRRCSRTCQGSRVRSRCWWSMTAPPMPPSWWLTPSPQVAGGFRCCPMWQPRQAAIAAEGGADRRSAKNAAAPMHQSHEAHHTARPHHSHDGHNQR
jgi:hypothetical protein